MSEDERDDTSMAFPPIPMLFAVDLVRDLAGIDPTERLCGCDRCDDSFQCFFCNSATGTFSSRADVTHDRDCIWWIAAGPGRDGLKIAIGRAE